ncbi:MAG: Crp/Fnr family transcriptional regulator [Alphaproteobacteria bacterium]
MREPERRKTLDGIALLKGLPPQEIRELAKICVWRECKAHEQIFDRHHESHDIYFVVAGKVRIVNYSMSGREVSFDDIPAGGSFGELAAIDGGPRSASVVAIEDTTVATLSPRHVMELVDKHPTVAVAMLRRLAHMVRTATDRIMDLSTLGAHNRVYAELLRLAREAGGSEEGEATIRPIPTHSEIASRVSTTRETVARVLSELQHNDLVRRDHNALFVADIGRLRDMVEEFRGE